MVKIINGKEIAAQIKEKLKKEITELEKNGIKPGLAVIKAGNDPASAVYVRNKVRTSEEIGIYSQVFEQEENVSQEKLIEIIEKLNKNPKIHGILVQLPLPKHLDEKNIIEKIDSRKDVDCFRNENLGKLFSGNAIFLPCTPAGVIEMLRKENVEITGKECVVVGRSNIVGKPLSIMLLQENGTVTIAHSKTKNLAEVCRRADILVSAVGRAKMITEDMVKSGAVVIDVGINRGENDKLVGDVDFEKVSLKASYITPVPGGVGPMTIAILMKNTVEAAKNIDKL